MNRLTVERYVVEIENDSERLTQEELAVPIIDGVPLFEMVGDRWPGLATSLVGPPSGQWLGAPTYEESGRAVILDGSCGEAGCCGVFASVTLTDDAVRWSDFFARGRPRLPDGLTFEFDRSQYETTIASVGSSPQHTWVLPPDDAP